MKYKELFTVEFLHDYFNNGHAGQILFAPTPECAIALKNAGAFYKVWNNKLYIIVRSFDGVHPAVDLPAEAVFEFYWQPADVQFFSYTKLPLSTTRRYYSHNAINALRNGIKYLHALPDTFSAANAYKLGSFVSDGSGNCSEALADLAPGSSLADVNKWANRGAVAFLSEQHQVDFSGTLVTLPVQPAVALVNVEVYAWNHTSNFPDKLVFSKAFNNDTTVNEQQVDLRNFTGGLHRFVVNGTELFRYLDPIQNWPAQVGMISIYQNANLPSANRLVDGAGIMLSPAYTIRLSPVSVIWQYKSRTAAVKKVEDETAAFAFESTAPQTFSSKLPIRLQEKPYDKMVLEYNNTSPPDPMKTVVIKQLPCPLPAPLQQITKNGTNYSMATVFLNY